ncbi:MAG: AbrB/MazE/SpoVT family DNA-binding domain-containing protein [Candidatus Izemoplasmatales bacterium]
MIVEFRKKSQITIPREIISELNLQEGDHLEVSIREGVICLEPVAIYSKSYVEKLENTVMMINEKQKDYTEGPFSTGEDAIKYLDSKNNPKSKNKKTNNK